MHEFHITKDPEDANKNIIGLRGAGSLEDAWEMRKTSIVAKPNSQVSEWSPKVWLVHSLPGTCSVPKGTPKFHLFRKLTRDQKLIEQKTQELETKLNDLKKTVNEVSKLKQFDAEDKAWWDAFWSVRSRTRARLGDGEDEDCSQDEASLKLIRKLLWPETAEPDDEAPGQGNADAQGNEQLEAEMVPEQSPLADLQADLTPRNAPADASEFGRNRKTGYVVVGQDENIEVCVTAARGKAAANSKNVLENHLKEIMVARCGNEAAFVNQKIKVGYQRVTVRVFALYETLPVVASSRCTRS